jgi:hypothetical protein
MIPMIATYIIYGVIFLVYISVVAMAIWAMRQSEPSPGNEDMKLGRMPSFVNPDLVAERLRHLPELLPNF